MVQPQPQAIDFMQAALVDVSIHSFIGYDMMFTDLKKIWDPILWPLTFCSYSNSKIFNQEQIDPQILSQKKPIPKCLRTKKMIWSCFILHLQASWTDDSSHIKQAHHHVHGETLARPSVPDIEEGNETTNDSSQYVVNKIDQY